MFTFSRSQLRQFRGLLRRAKIDKPRAGVVPQLTLVSTGDCYALQAIAAGVAIELTVQATCKPDQFSLPLSVLNACESRTTEPITVSRISDDRIRVGWADQQIPQVKEHEVGSNFDLMPFPTLPETMSHNLSGLWLALREAVESADRTPTRYATDCIQLSGTLGQIAATDGQQAFAQSGFIFPWTNDVHIPALAVLGCRELPDDAPVAVGRTGDWVTLTVGDYRIALLVENERRFPQIDSIFPHKASSRSQLQLADTDAQFLVTALRKIPSEEDMNRPVTLDLNGHVVVRGRADDHSRVTELLLSQSRLEGQPVICNTNRELLARAARMGFREVYFSNPDSPAFCNDGQRQFVWALLTPKNSIPSQPDAIRIKSDAVQQSVVAARPRPPQRDKPVPVSPPPAQHLPSNEPGKPNSRTDAQSLTKLIEDAEALRMNLRDVLSKTNALVIGLKRQRQQSRFMRAALQSLRAVHAMTPE